MTQVQKIYKYDELNKQQDENRFETCEEIVSDIVERGIPSNFNPDDFIAKVSKAYGISRSEAKTCVKLALNQTNNQTNEDSRKQEKLNGNCGYFWQSGYSNSVNFKSKNDGMDSLSSLGSYNKLLFQIK